MGPPFPSPQGRLFGIESSACCPLPMWTRGSVHQECLRSFLRGGWESQGEACEGHRRHWGFTHCSIISGPCWLHGTRWLLKSSPSPSSVHGRASPGPCHSQDHDHTPEHGQFLKAHSSVVYRMGVCGTPHFCLLIVLVLDLKSKDTSLSSLAWLWTSQFPTLSLSLPISKIWFGLNLESWQSGNELGWMKLAVGVLLVEVSRISLQGEYCGRQGPLKIHHWSRRKEACMFVMSVFMNVYVMRKCVHRGTDLCVCVCVCVCVSS